MAVSILVNREADANFWVEFDKSLDSNPEAFSVTEDLTRADLLWENVMVLTYLPIPNNNPPVEISFINPDGVDYLDPTILLTVQISKDGTISDLGAPEDIPVSGTIPDEELERMLENNLNTPELLKEVPWEMIEPDIFYRQFVDEQGYSSFQYFSRDGLFTSGFSLPPQSEATPQ